MWKLAVSATTANDTFLYDFNFEITQEEPKRKLSPC